jgi:MFS family permease
VPWAAVLGISFVVMPFTHAVATLTLTAMSMGFGNGIGSGIIITLAADNSPEIGRPTFLGLWRELSDAGQGVGPLILAGATDSCLASALPRTGVRHRAHVKVITQREKPLSPRNMSGAR